MSDKQISVRIAVLDGKKAKAELVGFGKEGAAAIQQVDRAAMNAQGLQNFGYQIQDVIVQTQGGTDVMRALSMQLPQMLMGFGLAGAVIGTAAAAFLPLIGNMMTARDEVQSVADAVGDLSGAAEAYINAAKAAAVSTDDLIAKYGDLASSARNALSAMADAEFANVIMRTDGAVAAVLASLTEMRTFASSDMLGTSETVRVLADTFGMAQQDAAALREALDALASAQGLHEQAVAADAVNRALIAAYGSAEAMPPPLLETYRAMAQVVAEAGSASTAADHMAIGFDDVASAARSAALAAESIGSAAAGAIGSVKMLGKAMWDAAQARIAAQDRLAQMEIEFSPGGQAAMRYGNRGAATPEQEALSKKYDMSGAIKPPPASRKGGSGGGGASKAKSEAEREAERVYAATRTEAEKYAAELEKLNKLQADGQISSDTYARAVAQAQEAFAKSDETAKFWRDGIDNLNNGILDAVTNGGSLSDVLGDVGKMLQRAAWEAALFGTGPFAIGGGFSLLGGLGSWVSGLFSFDGGGHTGDGARSGGVDGRGGFLAVLHPDETVVDHTRPGAARRELEAALIREAGAPQSARPAVDLSGLLSFDGGGHTGDGARSGGVDGRGGFLAVLHPDETVVDHTRPGAARRELEAALIREAGAPQSARPAVDLSGLLSFDGGGHTGDGARSGGVDGRGGFLAVLHPDETVVDHTRPDAARRDLQIALMREVGAPQSARPAVDLSGLLSFDGGGHTGDGARSGGVDGRGGFLAVLHPDETVVDHTRPGAARRELEAALIREAGAPQSARPAVDLSGLLSFDGGGHTGDGARSGGVDGRGGFLAVLHPDETVVDHTRPDAARRDLQIALMREVGAPQSARPAVDLSALLSFEGGGHTGDGARSGGLDGRGGFLAIMHPRERVADLTRPQGGVPGGALQISLGPGLQAEWLGRAGMQSQVIAQETAARQARGLPAAMRHMQARGTAS